LPGEIADVRKPGTDASLSHYLFNPRNFRRVNIVPILHIVPIIVIFSGEFDLFATILAFRVPEYLVDGIHGHALGINYQTASTNRANQWYGTDHNTNSEQPYSKAVLQQLLHRLVTKRSGIPLTIYTCPSQSDVRIAMALRRGARMGEGVPAQIIRRRGPAGADVPTGPLRHP
jgi:hypothetical protein